MNKRIRKKVLKQGACIVCGKPALFDTPELLCSGHWMAWFRGSQRVERAVTKKMVADTDIAIRALDHALPGMGSWVRDMVLM